LYDTLYHKAFEYSYSSSRMDCRRAYFLLLAGELLWLSLIILTPYLAAKGFKLPSTFFYYFFSHFCHQRPERSFFLFGKQLPVCARDVSLYAAAFVSSLLYPKLRPICSTTMPSILYLVLFLFPMAFDGGTQLLGLRESTNLLRCITGILAGLIAPFFVIPLMMGSCSSIDVENGEGSN
jgi:uncharacterized membrane protein